ncbi:MAG: DUF721 domain-containing protein [FCB group bacterium]|nr:DUF721 domain-containing protein [FCB group bacterium]
MKSISIGDAIKEFLQSQGFTEKIEQADVIRMWPEIVGDKIASKTEAKRISKGMLMVKVSDSAWRNELVYMRENLRKKINSRIGKDLVKEIKFN